MPQRITTIITSLALVGAIFAGVPSSARAAAGTYYIGIAGADYASAEESNCNDLDREIAVDEDPSEKLRELSGLADTDGTIYLCPGIYHFAGGAEMTRSNIHLVGAGPTKTILDGGNSSRIVFTESNLIISNLTMQNAYADVSDPYEGGAVLAGGTVDVTSVTFKHNFADKGGGAIAAGDTVTVHDSVFTNNSTADQGGAIASHEFVRVYDSTFSGNSSIADAACIGGGGAIAAAHDVTAHDSVFTGNTAVLGSDTDLELCGEDGSYGGFGGAIATLGYEEVMRSTFTNNKAALVGGAIFSANSADTRAAAYVSGSTFTGNQLLAYPGPWIVNVVVVDGEPTLAWGRSGSAIAAFSTTPLVIDTSVFRNNGQLSNPNEIEAAPLCGAVFAVVLEVSGSTFTGNKSAAGSALCSTNSATVDASTFNGNIATAFGGAMYASGILEVTGSTFVKNRALLAGAIAIEAGCTGFIETSVFKGNFTRASGPKDQARKYLWHLGGAVLSWGAVTLTDNVFTRNRALRSGGAVYFLTSAAEAIGLMVGNRFSGNSGGKAGGAVGYNLADTASLPTRSQLRAAQRANRFSGNTAARGPLMGGVKVVLLPV